MKIKKQIIYSITISTLLLISNVYAGSLSNNPTASEVNRFFQNVSKDIDAINNGFKSEIIAAGWPQILDPARLNRDKDLKESKKIVSKASYLANFYSQKAINLHNQVTNETKIIANKGSLSKELDKFNKVNYYINKSWDIEKSIVNEVSLIINLLENNKSKWVIKSNQIQILDQKVLDNFNNLYKNINNLMVKQQSYANKVAELTM